MIKINDLLNVFSTKKPVALSPLKEPKYEIFECPSRKKIIDLFEDWAISHAGMTEVGGNTNRADYIDLFNLCTGQDLGKPYCVSAWQYRRRELEKMFNIVFDLPFTAGSQYFWSQTKSQYRFTEPARGRVAVFRSALNPEQGHFALCLSERLDGGQFLTFEFNTSGNGSRNCYAKCYAKSLN